MSEEERIKEILMEQLKLDENSIDRDVSIDSLAIDSLELMELLVTIEEEFDIEIPTEEAEKIVTVGDAAEQIKNAIG